MASAAPLDLAVKDRTLVDVTNELVDPWVIIWFSNAASKYLTASKVEFKKSLGGMSKDEYQETIADLQQAFPDKAEFKQACVAAGLLKKVIPPQKEYQHLFAEREVDVQRVCIRHSRWSRGTREWKEAVIWCNVDDLRSLSDALEQLTQGESICD